MTRLSAPFLSLLLLGTACSTVPDYEPVVDTSKIQDQEKYRRDLQECKDFTEQVDYSDEETVAALKGAAVGVGAVGTGVAVTLAAGGVVLLPVVLPIYGAAALVGGATNKGLTHKEEQQLRATVWNSCLHERGYTVLSAQQ